MRVLRVAGMIMLTGLILSQCKPEKLFDDPSARLRFSTDTVTFDTIFSTLGSTTRQLRIYNPYNHTLRISSIRLAGGVSSMFRINVDGVKGTQFNNIEILPRDSLYIFVAVTIDPTGKNNPALVHDSIVLTTNGNMQDVKLIAWAQDMHLFREKIIQTQVWTADKPYLVLGYVAVDSGQTLTIEAGTKIYLHRNSFFIVQGKLEVNGSLDQPVIFQSDRLEQDYKDIPGQWGAIILLEGSTGNIINYAEIRNATVGIQIGADSTYLNQDLVLSNTKIFNSSYYGVWAFGSKITAWNDVIADCGQWAISLLRGGDYNFNHCTVSNRGVIFSNRNQPSVVLSNYIGKQDYHTGQIKILPGNMDNATFGNCIIYGNMDNEIGLAESPQGGTFHYKFDHCQIKLDLTQFNVNDTMHFETFISNDIPKFINPDKYNFELDTLSFAKDAGSINIGKIYPLDIKEQSRTSDKAPDLGAYERIEGGGH